MKRSSWNAKASRSKGITLLEVLIGVGLLLVIVSFALPSVNTAGAKAELKSAVENVQYSVRMARNTARMTESQVVMTLNEDPDGKLRVIRFSSPESRQDSFAARGLQDFTLSTGIHLTASAERFVFDERGLVEQSGELLLASASHETLNQRIELN